VVLRLLELRRAHPNWGPKKLVKILRNEKKHSSTLGTVPSVRTAARILERAGEPPCRRARRAKNAPTEAPCVQADAPNDIWTVDFKGWWKTRDGRRAEPLTVRDAASRYVLCAQLVQGTRTTEARTIFERLFATHGLPRAIHVDNGTPFICTRARGGLSQLSAWWVAIGVRVTRSRLASPQDNGAHERMHRDLAADVERYGADTVEQQQLALDRWRHEFNHVRPHEALQMRTPVELYHRSARPYRGEREPTYPAVCIERIVASNGRISIGSQGSVFVSQALAKRRIGLEPLDDRAYRAWYFDIDLGVVTDEQFGGDRRRKAA
jgi:transposase InsO family protein